MAGLFLKSMFAIGVAAGFNMKTAYHPSAKFDLNVSEVEYRRTKAGRSLIARVYQPAVRDRFLPCSISTAARGTTRTARPKADGSRHCRERRACRGHRHDARAGSAVSGMRAGCQLRRALAQDESGILEWRSVEDRHVVDTHVMEQKTTVADQETGQ